MIINSPVLVNATFPLKWIVFTCVQFNCHTKTTKGNDTGRRRLN
jgi:hypothetical protein